MSQMTPREIVQELDKHIIGQDSAKRAVAIALRNRWRRLNVDEPLRSEITPKNILMIGPTGVGKTEISRRLATLANAPFIKVEATKFTEVGYVGREVDSIIRDLTDIAVKMTREKRNRQGAQPCRGCGRGDESSTRCCHGRPGAQTEDASASDTRQKFRKMYREGRLDEKEIEIDVRNVSVNVDIMAPPGMEEMTNQLQSMFKNMGGARKSRRKVTIAQARKMLTEEEAGRLVNEEEIKSQALQSVEQNGIVFIDELDKVAKRSEHGGPDVSREGVQRDLLPLVEGCTVTTKYGMVKTDHILFIASGAFHMSKPSDLIPELQGRLPIRVELSALTAEQFERILTEPDASLSEQYKALMAAEGVELEFSKDGVRRIAEIAFSVNERTENIGARRLHTVMERLLEEISFTAADKSGDRNVIDASYVDAHLAELAQDEDLSRYIL